jgi:hypothetical protein
VDVYKFEREDLKKKIEELYRFVDEKQDRSEFEQYTDRSERVLVSSVDELKKDI